MLLQRAYRLYRSVRPDKCFYSEFTKFLGALTAFVTPVTIVGDVIIRLVRQTDSDVNTFLELHSSYDLKQFVTQPTHNPGWLFDVVITFDSNAPQELSVSDVGVSDHSLIFFHDNQR